MQSMKQVILTVATLVAVNLASAQDASFTAAVDKSRIDLGDRLEVTFTLSGSTGGRKFRPPSFSDFLVLSGPNQSTSMQFINGAMSSSVSYRYILQPRQEGTFTIGPAAIEYGGKQLQTQPIVIEVKKGTSQPKQPSQTTDAGIAQELSENVFLRLNIDKPRLYQGEQLTVTYKLYTRVNIVNYVISKAPANVGFWSEDLEVPQQIQLTTEVVDGVQYRVGTLRKVAMFPQRSGTLELDPMEVECVVQVPARRRSTDWFDQFFNDPFFGNLRNITHKVRSKPVKVTVMSLPAENVPLGFSGAVGKFSLETWLDRLETRTNEPVTLKVRISGQGNLKFLNAPGISIPPTIERYDPKITDNISKQGSSIAGSRTFEYLLIPRTAGEQRIPSFRFTYFDPIKNSYLTLQSQEFRLNVERGTDLVAGPFSAASREDVRILAEDIRFIKSGNVTLKRRGDRFVGSVGFFALSGSPFLAFAGLLLYLKRREKVLSDVQSLRNRRARKVAQGRLAEAKKFLQANRGEEFYTEVSRSLWGYLSDKLGIPPADLSQDSVRTLLENKVSSKEIVARLFATLEQCEFARFAPSTDGLQMDVIYRDAVKIILWLESEIR